MTEPDVPLLIHSLAEFRDLIFASLEAADARQVVEIGGEDGTFTRELVAWGRSRGAKVVCIDPSPRDSLEELARADESLSLAREPSVDALTSLPPCDAYLIDGDHNYFTVRKELQLIAAAAPEGRFPLVFLHDVGWPCGRRDQYYNPDLIPPEDRHEYTWDRGVVVGHPGVVEGGFRGEGAFAAAVREGGPRNGVLTAVEDFRRERPALSFHVVPAIFGLGVIFDPSRPFGERLEELLRPYSSEGLLQRLEQNRLALYLAVLDLQDQLEAQFAQRDRGVVADLASQLRERELLLRDAQVENRALWRRIEQLEGRLTEAAAADAAAASGRSGEIALRQHLRQCLNRLTTERD